MDNELKLDLAGIASKQVNISNEYINCVHNNQKEIVVKKNEKIKRTINKTLYALGGAAVLAAGAFAFTQQKGASKLGSDMVRIAEEQSYQIFVDSHDPSVRGILVNGKAANRKVALREIIDGARQEGYTDSQIYIGLDYCCPLLEVQNEIQKPTLSESIATKNSAFLDYAKEKGATK